eukprot:2702720-Prymnesium_polylepis.1
MCACGVRLRCALAVCACGVRSWFGQLFTLSTSSRPCSAPLIGRLSIRNLAFSVCGRCGRTRVSQASGGDEGVQQSRRAHRPSIDALLKPLKRHALARPGERDEVGELGARLRHARQHKVLLEKVGGGNGRPAAFGQ